MSKSLISHGCSLTIGIVHKTCDPGCQIFLVSFEIKIVSTIEPKYFLHFQIYTIYGGIWGK